jgi:hypothetical protein
MKTPFELMPAFLAFADALVPELWIHALELAHHLDAFRRGKIEYVASLLSQPVGAALGVHTIADDDLFKPELID